MMTLISFAISVVYIYSPATVSGLERKDFFLELATLIPIMLLGHWIEMKSVAKRNGTIGEINAADAHLISGKLLMLKRK